MTVEGLITELSKFPRNALVLLQGYEGGLSEIGILKTAKVNLNQNREEWNGPHEEDPNGPHQAILLLRACNHISEK